MTDKRKKEITDWLSKSTVTFENLFEERFPINLNKQELNFVRNRLNEMLNKSFNSWYYLVANGVEKQGNI